MKPWKNRVFTPYPEDKHFRAFLIKLNDDDLLKFVIDEYDHEDIIDAIVSESGIAKITENVNQLDLLKSMDEDTIVDFVFGSIALKDHGYRIIKEN